MRMPPTDLLVVAHGGVGTPAAWSDGCRVAIEHILAHDADADVVDLVTDAAALMEDDPRFNAGTGASYRLDGQTIELDASLMDDRGRIGAVAAIQRVRWPIRVARDVMETPHILLAGPAAERFARAQGHAEHDPATPAARRRYEKVRERMATGQLTPYRRPWLTLDVERVWNFETPYAELDTTDTIGLVIARRGRMAVANSTGGASPMLAGRVGDTPLPGAGFWAGPLAAVATTGVGEEIARQLLAFRVYQSIEAGASVQAACEAGVARYPEDIPIGVIAVTDSTWAVAANQPMAWAAWTGSELVSPEPEPDPVECV